MARLSRPIVSIPALAALVGVLGCSGSSSTTAPPGSGCNDTVHSISSGYPASVPTSGWYTSDTRANGTVTLDSSIPPPSGLGCHSVKLVTGAATASPSQDKAQLFSYALAGTSLSSINTISYWAYRSSSSPAVVADPTVAATLSVNVQITGSSVPGNFATLVYEPYNQTGGQNAILNDTWQQWNATSGLWWSTKNGQSNLLTWPQVQALYPDGVVAGYGFNLGSNNPNLITFGDGLVFGTTSTNF
ncbi:MAG: hypothetical protein JST05_09310 [Acidobacteria bacterium]|nr:hypothetical protein [Acidobacteriota bacterium]